MKTAEEWVERYKDDTDGDCTRSEVVDYIRSLVLEIQSDALFHASRIIYKAVGEQMMWRKIPNCSEIAAQIETMAIDLKREKVE